MKNCLFWWTDPWWKKSRFRINPVILTSLWCYYIRVPSKNTHIRYVLFCVEIPAAVYVLKRELLVLWHDNPKQGALACPVLWGWGEQGLRSSLCPCFLPRLLFFSEWMVDTRFSLSVHQLQKLEPLSSEIAWKTRLVYAFLFSLEGL